MSNTRPALNGGSIQNERNNHNEATKVNLKQGEQYNNKNKKACPSLETDGLLGKQSTVRYIAPSSSNQTRVTAAGSGAGDNKPIPGASVVSSLVGSGSNGSQNGLGQSSDVTTIIHEVSGEDISISGILRFCKITLLYPYLRFLAIVGLKPLTSEQRCCSNLINRAYITFVVFVLFMGYVLQCITCFRRDIGFSYKDNIKDEVSDILEEDEEPFRRGDSSIVDFNKTVCYGNPVYVYAFPSVLHMMSYCYMLYLYWMSDNENLENLMERVFIQATYAHSSYPSEKKLLRSLQLMVTFGFGWILASSSIQAVQIYLHHSFDNIGPWLGFKGRIGMAVAMGISTLWIDCVQMTVIISYCVHCLLISDYLDLIHSRIVQHSVTLAECIKEIGELHRLIDYLNHRLATGFAPLLVINTAFSISSSVYLIYTARSLYLCDLLCLMVFTTLWLALLILPLTKVSKLCSACKSVKELGHMVRMRPFGYQATSQSDLDSFLLFTSTLKLDVRIWNIPINEYFLSLTLILLITIFLVWGLFRS